MEYHRDPKNQIYADLAYRLGKIVVQYEKMLINDEKFEATLYLAVLQNLMTNCKEHMKEMIKLTGGKESIFNMPIESSGWGIVNACWIKNTFNEDKLTLENFITRLRNSISHPTDIDITSDYPSTGFTTIKSDSGFIQKFRFINSPDSTKNGPKPRYFNEIESTIYEIVGKKKEKRIRSEFPKEISYEQVKTDKEIKYILTLNGKPFFRLSIIDLTVTQLASFVKNLANYLAQPIQEKWDGITISELIAA